jgi:2,3-bisphosphoglycerate-dependent phosphoglycerate mutase
MSVKLILLRHGQSDWNRRNLFTGWSDVDLTEQGREEAVRAARLLASEGLHFDVAVTSVLKRAIRTLWLVMDGMDRMWVPAHRTWRLNERHYGQLQGLDKRRTAEEHGEAQVRRWRRSFRTRPPPVAPEDGRHPSHDPRYRSIPASRLPASESLEDTDKRVTTCWDELIAPPLRAGRTTLVVAHGNSLRALVKLLDGIPADEIADFNIPTAVPLVYELDAGLAPVERRFLGDPDAVAAAARAIADQTRA